MEAFLCTTGNQSKQSLKQKLMSSGNLIVAWLELGGLRMLEIDIQFGPHNKKLILYASRTRISTDQWLKEVFLVSTACLRFSVFSCPISLC